MRRMKSLSLLVGKIGNPVNLVFSRGLAASIVNTAGEQQVPEPIPNRPLRGERSKLPQSSDASLLSDEAFLDKLNLGSPPAGREDKSDWIFEREKLRPVNDSAQVQNDECIKEERRVRESPQVPESADKIFREMKETGLIPNAVAMLDGLCKDGLIKEAMKLFNSMREKGSFPDVIVYTAVVEGFCKSQKFDDAKRVFHKMQNNGVVPNAFSYGVLIRGLCWSEHHLDDAVDLTLEMLRAGHSPNIPTFVQLVDGLCRVKGIGDTHSVVRTLTDNGLVVNHKAISDYVDKNAPLNSDLSEAIFGHKRLRTPF